ncbi:hypothetical protein [Geobacter sp.]|uniref:major capsid protein n=1 Tax=Geobacter sp. TaxID=46610 RepID=UPI002632725A|nr:hypothetical protein [Geobacter sp.]
MAGRTSELRIVDPILTTFARGYKNAALVCDTLFPWVGVDKEAGKLPQFGKEAFRIYQTLRALRAKSNRINPESYGHIDVILEEHDLEYPIDYRERQEASQVLPLERWATNVVTQGIRLRCEKQCADLAQDVNSYPTGNKIVLAGGDKFSAPTTSNPIGVIEDGKDAVRQRIGTNPNTGVIGYEAWKKMKQHPQFIDRIKYSMKGVLTVDLLKEIIEVDNIIIGAAVFDNEAGGAFTDLWADNIILAYVPQKANDAERSEYEPSFGYTFRKKDHPLVDTRVEDGKVQIIRNTDIFKPYIVGGEAGYLIKGTN